MTTLAERMEAARKRVAAETEYAIPKDDGLLVIGALMLEALEEKLPCPSDADGQAAFGNSETDEELAITLAQIRKIRDNVHDLTDAVIAAMADKMLAQRYPAPPGIDWTARVLAGIAAAAAIATLVLVART